MTLDDQACASTSMQSEDFPILSSKSSPDQDSSSCSSFDSYISAAQEMPSIREVHSKSVNQRKKPLKNTIIFGIIYRLHQWCSRLLWLTMFTVISFCGDVKSKNGGQAKMIKEVRQNIASGKHHRRSRTVHQLKFQLLQHLKQLQAVEQFKAQANGTYVPHHTCHKRKKLSRPPSPQLFDIIEDNSNEMVD